MGLKNLLTGKGKAKAKTKEEEKENKPPASETSLPPTEDKSIISSGEEYPYLSSDKRADYYPDSMVVKEMMHQKGISKEEAIHLLRNPV